MMTCASDLWPFERTTDFRPLCQVSILENQGFILHCQRQCTHSYTHRHFVTRWLLYPRHCTTSSAPIITCCARGDTICPSPLPLNTRNVAVLSHAEYVPTLTAAAALRVKAAPSKAAWWPWPLTFWPWKWCPSHAWCGLPLCQFLVTSLRPRPLRGQFVAK